MKRILPFLMLAGLGLASASRADDGMALVAGHGDDTDMVQLSLVRQWDRQWFTDGNWTLTGYWEASLGRWNSAAAGSKPVWDIGLAPVFRLQAKASDGWRPYLEGAVGIHFISHTHPDAGRDMGSSFQFGDHLGVGVILGRKGQFDLGYRFQHLSNADIKSPNSGINFQQLRFAYLF